MMTGRKLVILVTSLSRLVSKINCNVPSETLNYAQSESQSDQIASTYININYQHGRI